MDEEPRRAPQRRDRYDNGNTRDENRRKDSVDWNQLLLETGMDQWDISLRRGLKDNLIWMSAYRVTLSARRRILVAAIGFGVTLLAAFGSWIGTSVGNAARTPATCPPGYICIQTTPNPGVSP